MSDASRSMTVIEADAGTYVVRAERRIGVHAATGEARLQAGGAAIDPSRPPHAGLAGARAWLSLGQARMAAGSFAEAMAAARAGLDELGTDYAAPGVKDDTRLKLDAAEERREEGRLDAAARVMLRVLEARIELYPGAHHDVH